MKISYLSAAAIPSESANSVHIMKMCAAMTKDGHNVTLECLEGQDEIDPFVFYGVESRFKIFKHNENTLVINIILHKLRRKIPFVKIGPIASILYGITTIKKKLSVEKPHLIYARNYNWLCPSMHIAPFILEVHAPPQNFIETFMIRRIIAHYNFTKLVTISEKLKAYYLNQHPTLNQNLVQVLPDAADIAPIKALECSPSSHSTIGYVGKFYRGRGIELIIELARRVPDKQFHLIGGDIKDLRNLGITRLPPDNIHLHGHVPHGKLHEYYALFDIALAPYQDRVCVKGNTGDTSQYMSPLKLFEYMSWGKAIICSNLSVLTEVLEDGENALLVQHDAINEWVKAIKSLSTDPELYNKLRNKARESFKSSFTWQGRARQALADSNRQLLKIHHD